MLIRKATTNEIEYFTLKEYYNIPKGIPFEIINIYYTSNLDNTPKYCNATIEGFNHIYRILNLENIIITIGYYKVYAKAGFDLYIDTDYKQRIEDERYLIIEK